MDLKAISDALAAKFAPGTIPTPTGADPMRHAFGQTPKNVNVVPAVIIEPQDGKVVLESGAWVHTIEIEVVFVLGKRPGDPARVETQRQLWLAPLLSATLSGYTLGLAGTVKSALPTTWEFIEYEVGGDTYDGIRVHYQVIVRESITVAA